ncbi:MAG: arylsulfatase [Verrucomicrobiota bacterium]
MKKPNLVYILMDDMGYGDFKCQNPEGKIPTPHMDQLAQEGMRFSDAHSNSAVCTPTRYGILTGNYAWRSRLKEGVLFGYDPPLIEPEVDTLPAFLQRNGYQTWCVGKWHLGLGWQLKQGESIESGATPAEDQIDFSKPLTHSPNSVGFDYSWFISASLDMNPYCYIENYDIVTPPDATCPAVEGGLEVMRAGRCAPDFSPEQTMFHFKDKAVELIDQQGADDPFFLYLPLTGPHTPVLPAPAFRGKSQAGPYGDFVMECDWIVGQVVEALERNGLQEDTLVIVTSDNGSSMERKVMLDEYGHKPNYIYRGRKSDIWDGGHRIPYVASWPNGIPAGTVCDQSICLTDLYATMVEILDQPIPENAAVDSQSHLALLQGETESAAMREPIVHHSFHGEFAVRDGCWKAIFTNTSGGWSKVEIDENTPAGQLYDMQEDPEEKNNLWNEHPEIVARIRSLLDGYQSEGRSVVHANK